MSILKSSLAIAFVILSLQALSANSLKNAFNTEDINNIEDMIIKKDASKANKTNLFSSSLSSGIFLAEISPIKKQDSKDQDFIDKNSSSKDSNSQKDLNNKEDLKDAEDSKKEQDFNKKEDFNSSKDSKNKEDSTLKDASSKEDSNNQIESNNLNSTSLKDIELKDLKDTKISSTNFYFQIGGALAFLKPLANPLLIFKNSATLPTLSAAVGLKQDFTFANAYITFGFKASLGYDISFLLTDVSTNIYRNANIFATFYAGISLFKIYPMASIGYQILNVGDTFLPTSINPNLATARALAYEGGIFWDFSAKGGLIASIRFEGIYKFSPKLLFSYEYRF